ncbi:PREDICTED: centromere protein K, partial [Merops nubicus]|uniref:centromere protein K n=1 Tax=Merops nubicus TaxID=57421 RepID=UPI0004F002DB
MFICAAGYSSKIVSDPVYPADPREELLDDCENIWKQLEECHSKLMNMETETVLNSNGQFSVLPIRMQAATAECLQWQRRKPKLLSTKPEVLLALGKEELQNVKSDLDMLLSTVEAKNKQLEEDLEREEQWQKEQEKLLDVLHGTEEDVKAQVGQFHKKSREARALNELQRKIMNVSVYKQELLDALGAFLEEHFPLPEKSGDAKNK